MQDLKCCRQRCGQSWDTPIVFRAQELHLSLGGGSHVIEHVVRTEADYQGNHVRPQETPWQTASADRTKLRLLEFIHCLLCMYVYVYVVYLKLPLLGCCTFKIKVSFFPAHKTQWTHMRQHGTLPHSQFQQHRKTHNTTLAHIANTHADFRRTSCKNIFFPKRSSANPGPRQLGVQDVGLQTLFSLSLSSLFSLFHTLPHDFLSTTTVTFSRNHCSTYPASRFALEPIQVEQRRVAQLGSAVL